MRDFAPRVAFAWAPGIRAKRRKDRDSRRLRHFLRSLRAGQHAGGGTLQRRGAAAVRGRRIPTSSRMSLPLASLWRRALRQAIQEVDAHLRAPTDAVGGDAGTAVAQEQTLAITYTNSHAVHVLRSQDINAPLPGTYTRPIPVAACFRMARRPDLSDDVVRALQPEPNDLQCEFEVQSGRVACSATTC